MLPIVIAPDPLLATVCEPCDLSDKSLKRLSKQMAHAIDRKSTRLNSSHT